MLDTYFDQLSEEKRILCFDAIHSEQFTQFVLEPAIEERREAINNLDTTTPSEDFVREYMRAQIEMATLVSIKDAIQRIKTMMTNPQQE